MDELLQALRVAYLGAAPSLAESIGHTQVGDEGVIEALQTWVTNEDLPEVVEMILEDIHKQIDDVNISVEELPEVQQQMTEILPPLNSLSNACTVLDCVSSFVSRYNPSTKLLTALKEVQHELAELRTAKRMKQTSLVDYFGAVSH